MKRRKPKFERIAGAWPMLNRKLQREEQIRKSRERGAKGERS